MSVEKNVNSKDCLVESKEGNKLSTWIRRVEGTIFTVRYMEESGYAYGIGNERVSNWFESEEEVYRDINKMDWDILVRIMDCLMRNYEFQRELERRIENEH